MAQYIDKDALVAEIEKLMGNPELIDDWRYRVKMEEKNELLKSIINTINALEVKEVDFDAEWERYFEHRGEMATVNVKHLAKHFFEIGLKAQKGEKV